MTIKLKPTAEVLDEVLVTGIYGSAKKLGSIVSSVVAIRSDKIENRPSANFADALQGQVAGLQVYTSSGEPSEGVSIRLPVSVHQFIQRTAVYPRRFSDLPREAFTGHQPERYRKRNRLEGCFFHLYLWFTCCQRCGSYHNQTRKRCQTDRQHQGTIRIFRTGSTDNQDDDNQPVL